MAAVLQNQMTLKEDITNQAHKLRRNVGFTAIENSKHEHVGSMMDEINKR